MERPISSGNLKGYYIIDLHWTKKEKEDFLIQIKSLQEQNKSLS